VRSSDIGGMCRASGARGDQVRITRNAADVEACTPVGNIDRIDPNSDIHSQMQNQAVGLRGNVVFETTPIFGNVATGVVYRCGAR